MENELIESFNIMYYSCWADVSFKLIVSKRLFHQKI